MKSFLTKLLILLCVVVPFTAHAFDIPARPAGFVDDYAGMLTADQVNTLEIKLESFEKNTTNEIAVVTIPSLDGDTIENLAQNIFTKWAIGKKDKNNGVLLLISLADKKTRIQTGYGVEGDLTDIGTSYIQSDVITPAFKNGDYNGGINGAVDKMIDALGGNNIVPGNYSNNKILANIPWQLIFYIVIFIFFQFLAYRARKHKKNFGVFPWWWFGGGMGGGGGGSGGGFGGFGGGMSGGGGSSGSW